MEIISENKDTSASISNTLATMTSQPEIISNTSSQLRYFAIFKLPRG